MGKQVDNFLTTITYFNSFTDSHFLQIQFSFTFLQWKNNLTQIFNINETYKLLACPLVQELVTANKPFYLFSESDIVG